MAVLTPVYRPPSRKQGFQRSPSGALYPNLWKGLELAYPARLGPTGGTLRDLGGRKNDATMQGGMAPDSAWVTDAEGYSLLFDASAGHYMTAGRAIDLGVNFTATVRVWVASDTGSPQVPLNTTAGTRGWRFIVQADLCRCFIWTEDGGYIYPSKGVSSTTDAYHTLSAVVQATEAWLYFDGEEIDHQVSSNGQPVAQSADPPTLGRYGGSDYLDGRLGMACVHDRCLGLNEVRLLHRDPIGLARPRVRLLPAVSAVPGPYEVAAGSSCVSGSRAGAVFSSGSEAGTVP